MHRADRIAVILPNHLGDVVMSTAALRALRSARPEARILGVVREELASVLEGGPWLDALRPHAVYRSRNPARRLRARLQLARELSGYDVVLVFPNSFSSALLAALSRASARIGYRRRARGWLLTERVELPRRNGRVVPIAMERAYLALLEPLGVSSEDTRLELFCAPEAEREARELLRAGGMRSGRPLVSIAPGAAFGPSKLWPMEYFAQVARGLVAADAQVALIHAPGEQSLADAILAAAGPGVVSLGGAGMTLALLKSIVRRSDLVICNDAGARHIAAAFGVATIVLMGPTSLDYTSLNLGRTRILRTKFPCQPCQLKVCPIDHRCMTQLLPERVSQEALAALDDPAWSGDSALEGSA